MSKRAYSRISAMNARQKIRQQAERDAQDGELYLVESPNIALPNKKTNPLFNELNIDVRRIIYDYLYRGLSPLSRVGTISDCRGLVLSCKQAYKELAEAAGRHLIIFTEGFCSSLAGRYNTIVTLYKPIPIHDGFPALRNILFSLPFSSFNFSGNTDDYIKPQLIDYSSWKNFWAPQLFRYSFDRVTFILQDGDRPPHATEKEREAIAGAIYDQLKAIEFCISPDDDDPRTINRHTRGRMQPSNRSSNRSIAKHIGFAWNLVSSSSDSSATSQDCITMTGKKFFLKSHYAPLNLEYESVWPHSYEVMSTDGLVGEIALVSPWRWSEGQTTDMRLDDRIVVKESIQMIGIGGELSKVGEKKD